VLSYRFDEQYSQEEVAAQMAVGPRQVRRLEFIAIRDLASYLVEHYPIQIPTAAPLSEAIGPATPPPAQPDTEQEYQWLKETYSQEVLTANKLIDSILETGASLLKAHHCQIVVEIAPGLSPAVGQLVTLRQAFLTLLLAAIRSGAQDAIHISASPTSSGMLIAMTAPLAKNPADDPNLAGEVNEFFEQARRLVELSDGVLDASLVDTPLEFTASVILQFAEEINLLVVDDNEDSLRLFQRYLAGTRFNMIGVRDVNQVIAQAERIQPKIIILDIMLPEIDGWELLGRLRHHPNLEKIPVVISTILPHEQLAASLGAAGFLRKPFSREKLLELLSQQVDSPEP
jgi:CheY-like chemotaxis protein